MVTAYLEDDEVGTYNRFGTDEGRDTFQRIRSPKAIRSVRKTKKPASPGSMRLRRNKHWSW